MSKKTVVLKLSGELFGSPDLPVDPSHYVAIARRVIEFKRRNDVRLIIIVGGGNIFRGRQIAGFEFGRTAADYMGMLATIINGEGLKEALNHQGAPARNMTAIAIREVTEPYIYQKALSHLSKDYIVVVSGGLGRAFVTTDSAAAHYAIELGADIILKATHVDGVYDKDPGKFPDAIRFNKLTFQLALERELKIMDVEAFAKCRKEKKTLVVFHIDDLDRLDINNRDSIGTWITN
jgi:uridylate kinase